MRCRVGDLCIAVGRSGDPDENGARGAIVEVMAATPSKDRWGGDWFVDWPAHPADNPHKRHAYWNVFDSQLVPLRPGEGEDETLTWAGKPVESVRDALEEIRKELA